MRRMIEHNHSSGSGAIDGWRCSHCRWSRHLDHPIGKLDVPFNIRSRAEAAFVRHICAQGCEPTTTQSFPKKR